MMQQILGILLICGLLCGLLFGIWYAISKFDPLGAIGKMFTNTFGGRTELGGSCNLHTDCKGWGPAHDDAACCDGKCTTKKGGWCPNEGPNAGKGIGGSCNAHTDCNGWGPGATDVACCRGRCERKKKDWAGVGYCPHECVGDVFKGPGSC